MHPEGRLSVVLHFGGYQKGWSTFGGVTEVYYDRGQCGKMCLKDKRRNKDESQSG